MCVCVCVCVSSSFSAPFCVHAALCGDVYTTKHSMHDSFLFLSNTNRLCGVMQTDVLLDSGTCFGFLSNDSAADWSKRWS